LRRRGEEHRKRPSGRTSRQRESRVSSKKVLIFSGSLAVGQEAVLKKGRSLAKGEGIDRSCHGREGKKTFRCLMGGACCELFHSRRGVARTGIQARSKRGGSFLLTKANQRTNFPWNSN